MSYRLLALAIAATTFVMVPTASAIITSDTSGSHVVAAGETAFGVNLDGVGYLGWPAPRMVLPVCTGSLIGDRDILTAAHCIVDEDGQPVLFDDALFPFQDAPKVVFETTDGRHVLDLIESETRYFADYADSFFDLAVVRLAEPAPTSIPRYAVYSARDQVGKTTVLAGYGGGGHGSSGEELVFPSQQDDIVRRAGLNRFEALGQQLIPPQGLPPLPGDILLVTDFDSGEPSANTLAQHGIPSDLGFGAEEVGPAWGDSGGPAFIDDAIAGVMASVLTLERPALTPPAGLWGEGAASIRLSEFRDFLVEATQGRVVFVPEPNGVWLVFVAFVAIPALARVPGRSRHGH